MILRPAARLLVVDTQQRVLLLRFNHRRGPLAGQIYWATPGGALDPGESFETCALRELAEETGIEVQDAGPVIHERRFPLQMSDGSWVEAQERFFLIRVTETILRTEGRSDLEAEMLDDHRWWSAEDLRETREVVHPAELPEILRLYFG